MACAQSHYVGTDSGRCRRRGRVGAQRQEQGYEGQEVAKGQVSRLALCDRRLHIRILQLLYPLRDNLELRGLKRLSGGK